MTQHLNRDQNDEKEAAIRYERKNWKKTFSARRNRKFKGPETE